MGTFRGKIYNVHKMGYRMIGNKDRKYTIYTKVNKGSVFEWWTVENVLCKVYGCSYIDKKNWYENIGINESIE